jgi:hypothetical protein
MRGRDGHTEAAGGLTHIDRSVRESYSLQSWFRSQKGTNHAATFAGVSPRFLSRCVFLLPDGPVAAAAGKQRDGYVHSRRVLLNEPDFG